MPPCTIYTLGDQVDPDRDVPRTAQTAQTVLTVRRHLWCRRPSKHSAHGVRCPRSSPLLSARCGSTAPTENPAKSYSPSGYIDGISAVSPPIPLRRHPSAIPARRSTRRPRRARPWCCPRRAAPPCTTKSLTRMATRSTPTVPCLPVTLRFVPAPPVQGGEGLEEKEGPKWRRVT